MEHHSSPPKDSIRLPHGAWLSKKDNLVHVPTGNILLKFALSEIDEFATIMDDIATVLSSNMTVTVHKCQSCGTEIEEIDYEDPEGEDLQ
jgi:hypothetical protein